MGYIKKLKNNELVGGTDKTTIYPVTSTEAVFEEVSDSEFKSQKYLNNHITNERIVDNTIENRKLKDDTVDMGKLNTQLKTIIQNAYDASWKVKEEPFSLETKYDANDVVYDPDTNSSYVSLTADNQGNPVNPEDEGYVEGKWRIIINGISAVESTEVIDAKVIELTDQVDDKINDAQDQLDDMIANAATELARATKAADDAAAEASAVVANKVADAQIGYFECNTATGTALKQTTFDYIGTGNDKSYYTIPAAGSNVRIKMQYANTATGTIELQFGSNTATRKQLIYNGEPASISNSWDDGEVISIYYDPTYNSGVGAYQASNAQGGGGSKGIKELKGITGAYITNNGSTLGSVVSTGAEAPFYQYIKYPVNEGDVVMVSGHGAAVARLWGIVGDNNVMIDKSASVADGNNLVLVMPEGARYITLNSTIASNPKWYYAKKDSAGAREIIDKENIYKGINYLEVGKNYDINEVVLSTDKRLLKIKKSVSSLDLSHIINKRDIKTYNNNTYLAQKNVKEFADTSLMGASTEEPIYSLGSPTKLLLNISRGNCNIEVSFTNGTEMIGNKVNITPSVGYTPAIIATAVYEALSAFEDTGWIFTDKGNGSITAEYPATEGYSDYNIVFSASCGITSTSTVAVTDSSTIITMVFSIGTGTISATFKGISYDISIGASTTSSQVATSIAETFANIEGWAFESDGSTVSAICLEAGNNSSTEFKLTDGVLGVTYTLSKPWIGSNNISHFDGVDWVIDTLATYSSSIVFTESNYINGEWLIDNITKPTSLAKEIEYDEYTISKKIIDIDKELKEKSSKQDVIDNEYVIAKAFNKLVGTNNGGNSSSNKGVLSVANSDIINVIGSSYTFGGFTLAGKNWVHRIAELSDYQYHNDGRDGASYDSQLNGNYQANSIRFKKYCIGKYVILNDNENRGVPDNKTNTQWFKTLDNIVRVCMGLGIEPILATNWSQGDNFQGVSQMYEDYAREHGLIYMNGNYYSKTLSTNYTPFNAGTHLGTRCQGIFSDAYIPYLERMERPYKSMKIFRLRNSYTTNDLDQLMFTTNRERLKMFRELWCGNASCDQNRVDNSPNASMTTKCPNEYATLRNNGAISFTRAALISAVLPYTGKDITQLEFVADIQGDVQVYVKDVLATPYPSVKNYTRFNIPNEITTIPSTGAVYSDGTTSFTVSHVILGENGSFCTIYMNGWTDGNQEGTLTKSNGSGDTTISYNIREQVSQSASESDTCGHWVKIEKESTKYVFTNIASRIVDIDKLHILIIGDSFTLSQPRIYYAGEQVKHRNRKEYKLLLNEDNSNQELIQEPTFGTVGTVLNTWKDDSNNNLISEANYEIIHPDKWNNTGLPASTSSILKVDDVHAINTIISSVPSSGNLMLEIYARYFAPIYTDGSGNQITFESYDYEDMYIQMGDLTYGSTIKKTVGLMWQIIQIPMVGPGQISSKLRIYGGPKGIEIAKVSLKKVQNYETY